MVGSAGANARDGAPLVSVVVPTRNRAALVAELVRGLAAQSLSGWEALIVDDGSDAAELAALRELVRPDGRIAILERGAGPPGANRCRNLGARAARAELVVFLDDDDLLSPGCLEARVDAMRARPELDLAVFPYERFETAPGDRRGDRGPPPSRTPVEDFLRLEPPWHTGGPIWRRSFLARVGDWDERLTSWQDWDYGLRALALGPRLEQLAGPAFHVRVPSSRHRTISHAGWEPRNVRSWALAVESVHDRLESLDLLTPERRALLAVLHAFVAERLVVIGERARAAELWGRCVGRGLAGPPERAVAAVLFGLARVRGARAVSERAVVRALHSRRLTRALASGRAGRGPR